VVGNGSGVAYKRSDDGGTYILTNNHVVDGATSLVVRDESGRSTSAKLVGTDPETDLALLQIQLEALPVVVLGDVRALQKQARQLAATVQTSTGSARAWSQRIDAVVLHPLAGPLLLAAILFFMFQAVFSWAEAPMGWIEAGVAALQAELTAALPEGWFLSLLNDGVLAGVGAVVVFLPQILILFLFIITLEQTGYMTRAAFLMDRLMARVGLNGRAFIPLLSSFACAVPGIMATRTIDSPRDRLTTILIAPLMTCSARLPVYAVVIGAFIPARDVGPFGHHQAAILRTGACRQ
jgi:ferrous iron transport protein B